MDRLECHGGNIHVRLRLSKPPEDNPLRACTCSFCRSHSPRAAADLGGLFKVWAGDWLLVENYRCGTRTSDFLICRRCGAVIAGSRGNDGRTARGRQCELLERSCALSVPALTTLRERRVKPGRRATQRTGCQRSSAAKRQFSAQKSQPLTPTARQPAAAQCTQNAKSSCGRNGMKPSVST